MSAAPRRRFALSDGLILIGAIAVGLAPAPYLSWHFWHTIENVIRPEADSARVRLLAFLVPILWACTLAEMAILLRRPRPPIRWLARRPGFAACIAVVFGSLVGGLSLAKMMARMPLFTSNVFSDVLALIQESMATIAPMILLAWLIQGLMRRRRPRASGLDRLGVALGLLWVVALVANESFLFLKGDQPIQGAPVPPLPFPLLPPPGP